MHLGRKCLEAGLLDRKSKLPMSFFFRHASFERGGFLLTYVHRSGRRDYTASIDISNAFVDNISF